MTCPHCPEYELEMYEHYDEYDDGILRQDQHFQCPNCHHVYSSTVWYRKIEEEWDLEDHE